MYALRGARIDRIKMQVEFRLQKKFVFFIIFSVSLCTLHLNKYFKKKKMFCCSQIIRMEFQQNDANFLYMKMVKKKS